METYAKTNKKEEVDNRLYSCHHYSQNKEGANFFFYTSHIKPINTDSQFFVMVNLFLPSQTGTNLML